VESKLDGMDALLSCVQMPPGIPTATVGIDRGDNAVLLALEILALSDEELSKKLEEYRKKLREKVINSDKRVRELYKH
ncbi:MAG TPA: AIR carboxylase family protein, partial [Methanothermococcus okinawensis]|nr:AIR carboxylase family protein [Methanothermococcus okinawensis]